MSSSVFRELRQRKVFRGAALYVVVGWVIAQAAEILTQALSLPTWTLTLVLVLLVLGFPLALVLAWIFEVTPSGIRYDSEVDHGDVPTSRTGRIVDFAIIAVLLVAVSFFGKAYFSGDTLAPAAARHSIAVLPFVNMSGDPARDYFSDGVSEEVLNSLAKIPGLQVAARTSSFYFKGRQEDLRRIGEQLGVDTVLEGSVRQDGDQVRITAQLVDTRDGFHIWSATFDYELKDIFAIQDDIARAVVRELKISLLGETPVSSVANPTADPDAYRAYLRGRYELHRRIEPSIIRANGFFRDAVQADPDYADAWVGLAESFILQHTNHQLLPRDEAVEKANNAIEQALTLTPDSAEAHAALGLVRMEAEQLDAAETAFERSISLNPRYAEAWHWYGLLHRRRGELNASFEKLTRAVELDPLHPVARTNLGDNLLARGKLDDAVKFFERGTELDSDFPVNYLILGLIEASKPYCNPKKAMAWTNAALARGADNIDALSLKASLFLALDDVGSASQVVETMLALKPDHPASIYAQVTPLVYRGHSQDAATLLDGVLATRGERLGKAAHMMGAMAAALRGEHKGALADWYLFDASLDDEVPQLSYMNAKFGTLIAWSMLASGDDDRAAHILNQVEGYLHDSPQFGPKGRQLTDIEIALLRGNSGQALGLLEQAVADGYRIRLVHGSWLLENYPILAEIRDDPRFQRALDTIGSYNSQFL